jgi:hypothetical protein
MRYSSIVFLHTFVILDSKVSVNFALVSEGNIRYCAVVYPGMFFRGEGVQQIQLRREGIENGDLGAVAP